ncbi:MAG: hypothetical protein SOY73_08285 [Blautia sp.]|nr:hypothetical protein [Blautia sp.]
MEEHPRITAAEIHRTLLCSGDIHGILGKYVEAMTHHVSLDTKKKVYFNEHIWGL